MTAESAEPPPQAEDLLRDVLANWEAHPGWGAQIIYDWAARAEPPPTGSVEAAVPPLATLEHLC